MATLADVRFQMRMLGYGGFLLSRGEVRELPSLLREGEKIEQAIYGGYEGGFGMMVATNHRLMFIDRRFFHKHISEIPYPAISAVELDTNAIRGSVTIFARGSAISLHGISNKHARNFFNFIDGKIDIPQERPEAKTEERSREILPETLALPR